jgi:DNA-binding MarR family transcriptional regulator
VTSRRPSLSPERADLLARLHVVGRESGTAAVMFHSTLAATQGLSATDTKAVDILDREGPLTAGELAARTGLAPPSVTGLIDRLERKGFVRRIEDPADRRRVRIERRSEALQAFEPLFRDFGASLDALYEQFTDDQLGLILRFMTAITACQREATTRLAALAPTIAHTDR